MTQLTPLACQLSGVRAGDFVYFLRAPKGERMADAIVQASRGVANVFHVAMLDDDDGERVIHATPEKGVIRARLEDAIRDDAPDAVEIRRIMSVDKEVRFAALEWARAEVGAAYNDLFAPDCINSHGKRAFYCCQLMCCAYRQVAGIELAPGHKMRFAGADDTQSVVLPYWLEYFARKGHPVPVGEPGSHPAKLRARDDMRMLVSRVLRSTASSSSSSLLQAGLPQTLYFVDGNLLGNVTSERPFGVMEPRSGKKLVDCYSANEVQINEIVHSAKRAFPVWRDTPYAERAQVLLRASQLIRDRLDELARWETLDGGKPITEARADIASCADCFQYFAGVGSALAGEHIPIGGGRTAWTQREPLGVVAAVGAWNYPMQTASWKIAPALACGNSVVYKPSPLAPITAVALATLLTEAGLPPGVLNVVQGDGTTGEALVSHSDIAKVTFTGSFTTGQHILTACARRGIRPATMELGGKGSLIVLEDADVEMAVAAAMAANFYSQGQVCSNASKVLVARNLIEPIKRRLVELTSRLKVGDPLQEDTQVGAHISSEHRDKVLVFINDAISDGAKKLCGGEKIAPPGVENGFYLSPCILTDVSPSSRAFRFEIFGAVLMLIPFDHLEEAIECANATRAGLAHGVVTNNLTLAHQLASRLRAGTVYINTYNDVSSLVPFGGVDDAGFGRENGAACLSHFTNLKSVFLNHSGRLDNAFDKSQS